MSSTSVEYQIRFNGQFIGHVKVERAAGKREIELAAMAHPEVQKRLGEETIKSLSIVEDGVVSIVV